MTGCLAPVLSRHTGTAPNAHEPELTAREQRLQQQLVAEGSGPRSVAAQLDVVEVCEALLDLKVEVRYAEGIVSQIPEQLDVVEVCKALLDLKVELRHAEGLVSQIPEQLDVVEVCKTLLDLKVEVRSR
eukprot:1161335-Pelagomonas_calceolata.AAC.3